MISAQDPGVQNWIDTSGLSEGIFGGRLQSVAEGDKADILAGVYAPTTQVVPVADVLNFLPPDVNIFTPLDRADQIEERQDFVREKYVFW